MSLLQEKHALGADTSTSGVASYGAPQKVSFTYTRFLRVFFFLSSFLCELSRSALLSPQIEKMGRKVGRKDYRDKPLGSICRICVVLRLL